MYVTLLLYIDTLTSTFTLSPCLRAFLKSLPTLSDAHAAPMCVHDYLTSKTIINDVCEMMLRLCENNNDALNVNDMIDAFVLCLTRFDIYRLTLHETTSNLSLLDVLNTHENDVL